MKNSIKKYIALTVVMVVIGIGVFLIPKYLKTTSEEDKIEMPEIPLRIEEVPVGFNIIKREDSNILEGKYTNNSKYDISKLVLEVKLKGSNEIISLPMSEVVQSGNISGKYECKGPNSGKVEDIEILKYKISLSKGIYMEYDVESNQYNWS